MDASGLLTVLAVLLTGATLLPPRVLLDLKIRITRKDKWIFSGTLLFCVYFLFFNVLKHNGLVLPFPWILGFNERSSLLAVSLLLMVFIAVKLKETKLPKPSITKLNKEVDLLIKDGNFRDISYLLNKYCGQLSAYINFKPWYVSLHYWILPKNHPFLISLSSKDEMSKFRSFIYEARTKIAGLFPETYKVADEIEVLLSSTFKSRGLIDYWSKNYATLGLVLLNSSKKLESIHREEFIKLLIGNVHSQLYREMAQSQYISSSNCYEIDRSNSFLWYLFTDVIICEELNIYAPLKEYAVDLMKKEKSSKSIYNKECYGFIDSNKRYSCPIYMSIFLFDMMIREAIDQKLKKHLFPNYLYHIAMQLLDNIDSVDLKETDAEFPTRNYYLLYECFSTMSTWIDMIENRKDDSDKYDPYLIIESYGMMTYHLLDSDKISEEKKGYFLSIVLRTLQSLDHANLEGYAREIGSTITRLHSFKEESEEHLEVINKLIPIIRADDCLLLPTIRKYVLSKA
ncbi:hypothetical protein ACR30L_16205 [Psychromonas sp. PT13]|uniref:hypothetical protein n=1 Tax=Psychromonas sp. PT13 TaxID=3439547 RepID=UPI003EB6FA7D